MQPMPRPQPRELALPLIYLAPHRSLTSVYATADSLDRFDAIRRTVEQSGVTLSLLYSYWDSALKRASGAFVLDLTDARESPARILDTLKQVPGVNIRATAGPDTGLAAFADDRLNVAGTPVTVMAQPFLGQTYKLLIEALGDPAAGTLFRAGETAGHQAAAGVPALVKSLGVQLTPELIRARFYDLQVFSWASIVALTVDDRFVGDALLADDFEASAWHGQASAPTCHWIRGFLTGAVSSLTGAAHEVTEPECQGKGDRYCRFVFRLV